MTLAKYIREREAMMTDFNYFMDSWRNNISGPAMFAWAMDIDMQFCDKPAAWKEWRFGNEWREFERALKMLESEDIIEHMHNGRMYAVN